MPKYYDPCSFSNPDLFVITHIDLNWNVDFERKILKGFSTISFELCDSVTATSSDSIILDTRDLVIHSIKDSNDVNLDYELGSKHKDFGSSLRISLSNVPSIESLKSLKLVIHYETSPSASALQWLDANCTLGKKHPYLFSQCQAIHARSIVPCQDTPAVKFTYSASVTVAKPLVALMSAVRLETNTDDSEATTSTSQFEQKIKIPSYLIALAVGNLVCKQIGPISKVWTEQEMIDRAAYEFEEVGPMLQEAETLCGEYVWGAYDLLVLPPTFPYGGMENPCLTFVTPTLIAGDRSLVNVIQHEVTHSWTGNLVTNASWEHFWLNEGFTRFIERKLIGMYCKSELQRQFECVDGWRELGETVKVFGEKNQLTQLVPNLKDVDPDDAFSSIPYEKGHMLLFHLEQKLGGVEIFDKYLRAYIEKFKGKSIDTNEWKAFLYEYFSDKTEVLDAVDWNGWLYTPGMPPVELTFDQTIANKVRKIANDIYANEVTSVDPEYLEFNSNQKRELLSQLLDKEPLSKEKLESIEKFYQFGSTKNAELLFRWLRMGLKAKWTPIIQPALKFVCDQGRMKFTRPIYRDLFAWEETRPLAIENYQREKLFMHATTSSLVAKDLGLAE